MGDTKRPDQLQIYRPTDSKLIESFSREVAERLNDCLPDKDAKASFTRDLSTLLSLAAKIKARCLNNQHPKAAVKARKEANRCHEDG